MPLRIVKGPQQIRVYDENKRVSRSPDFLYTAGIHDSLENLQFYSYARVPG